MSQLSREMNRSQSRKSETDIELVTGLKRNPGSGCGKLFKGDNGNKDWHVEDKSTRQPRIVIKTHYFEKARYQSRTKNKRYFAVSYTKGSLRFYHVESTLLDTIDHDLRAARSDKLVVRAQSKSFDPDELAKMCETRSVDIDFMNGCMTSVINEKDFVRIMGLLEEKSD